MGAVSIIDPSTADATVIARLVAISSSGWTIVPDSEMRGEVLIGVLEAITVEMSVTGIRSIRRAMREVRGSEVVVGLDIVSTPATTRRESCQGKCLFIDTGSHHHY